MRVRVAVVCMAEVRDIVGFDGLEVVTLLVGMLSVLPDCTSLLYLSDTPTLVITHHGIVHNMIYEPLLTNMTDVACQIGNSSHVSPGDSPPVVAASFPNSVKQGSRVRNDDVSTLSCSQTLGKPQLLQEERTKSR